LSGPAIAARATSEHWPLPVGSGGSAGRESGILVAVNYTDSATKNPHVSRRLALGLLAATVYALGACLAFWPVSPLDPHHVVSCACNDQAQEVWFLNWTAFALAHGHNPLFTSYLAAPKGVNLSANTTMPLLGLLGWPVTALRGAVATYNVLLRLSLATSAISMYLLLRRYTTWWPAAFAGGLVFGFSPYMIGQGSIHLFLAAIPIPPMMIALVDDWLIRRRRGPVASGLLLGLSAGAQYLISPEVLLMTGLALGTGVVVLAARNTAEIRQRLALLAKGGAVAGAICCLIAGYAIWMLVAGPRHPIGPPHSVAGLRPYRNDLLGLVVPTSNQLLAPARLAHLGNGFVLRDLRENGVYLGVPLLLLLVWLVIRFRRVELLITAAAVGTVAWIGSLGARLNIGGHVYNGIPLPMALFQHVPLLQAMEPARFSLFVQLASAIILGVGLDRLRTFASPSIAGAIGLVALLPLLPALPYASVAASTPGFFGSAAARAIPAGASMLTFPYDRAPNNDAMLWQVASGMRFKILGGDIFLPGPHGGAVGHVDIAGPPALSRLFLNGSRWYTGPEPPDDQALRSELTALIRSQSVSGLLVETDYPHAASVVRVATQIYGRPPRHFGVIDLWTGRLSGS